MRLLFLSSCASDLAWFNHYYEQVFPEGKRQALDRYERTKVLLKTAPYAGHSIEGTRLRELGIARSPFAFIYRINGDTIEVVRVWDQRAERPDNWI